jgi:DNA polymerase-3 subunit epsilon/exodeoxyribonuclease X
MIETKTPILFFDTETTGILKDDKWNITSNWSMIQLAYRKIDNWKKEDKNMFFMTDTRIEIGSMAVHGIYPKLLEEKSWWKYLDDEKREEISKIMTENIIVAHNIDFDRDVLKKEWITYTDRQIDTLKVAKIMWSEWVLQNSTWEDPEYVNLQYLRYFFELYEINDSDWVAECTTAHDAFWDVVVLENVFYALFDRIKNKLNISDEEVIEIMIEMTKKEFITIKTMRIGKYRWRTFEEVADVDRWYLQWMIWADFTDDIKYTCKVWLGLTEDKKFFN